MELGSIPQWGQFAIAFAIGLGTIWGVLSKKAEAEARRAELQAAEVLKQSLGNKERLDRHDARLTAIETDLRHLPDKDIVHRLEMAMARLETEVKVITERVGPIKAIAERLQEAALEHGK